MQLTKEIKVGILFLVIGIAIGYLLAVGIQNFSGTGWASGTRVYECSDNKDNDGDGLTDVADNGCTGVKDNDESNCGDGICEGKETLSGCPADCKNPNSCADTDSGNSTSMKGTVSGYYNKTEYSNEDSCSDSGNVLEYYCAGIYKLSSTISCGADYYGASYCQNSSVYRDFTDYLCAGGVCSSATTPQLVSTCVAGCTNGSCNNIPDSCNDTDSGNVPAIRGTASGYFNSSQYSSSDACLNSAVLTEYYCSGASKQSAAANCGNNSYGTAYCSGNLVYKEYSTHFCTSGYCGSNVTQELQTNCDSQDGYGSNYCLNSSVYRELKNYYCSGGGCLYTATPEIVSLCSYGCASGVCSSVPNNCSETDGGMVPALRGITSGYASGSLFNYTDSCITNATLSEYWCSGTALGLTNYSCNSTCATGACS